MYIFECFFLPGNPFHRKTFSTASPQIFPARQGLSKFSLGKCLLIFSSRECLSIFSPGEGPSNFFPQFPTPRSLLIVPLKTRTKTFSDLSDINVKISWGWLGHPWRLIGMSAIALVCQISGHLRRLVNRQAATGHPWSSPHLIFGISRKSRKIFKQSGISGKPVKSRLEYSENVINLVRIIRILRIFRIFRIIFRIFRNQQRVMTKTPTGGRL